VCIVLHSRVAVVALVVVKYEVCVCVCVDHGWVSRWQQQQLQQASKQLSPDVLVCFYFLPSFLPSVLLSFSRKKKESRDDLLTHPYSTFYLLIHFALFVFLRFPKKQKTSFQTTIQLNSHRHDHINTNSYETKPKRNETKQAQSAFRYEKDVPLVVPEINGEETKKSKLIANPNCTTAIGLMALWPLIKAFGVKRVLMSTYQASSGAGQPGMDELVDGTKAYLEDSSKPVENKIFAHPLPFNVIPQIDKFQDNLYTKEEMKVTWETIKICGLDDDVPISCSAVRIPTIRAHSEVIVLETKDKVDLAKARQVLEDAPGVKLVDNPEKLEYPMPLTATGQYDVEVGRLRQSLAFGDHGLEFFVCGDQLLRGAALNAVLVAECMHKNGALEQAGVGKEEEAEATA